MEELIEKVENLKKVLEQEESVQRIKMLNQKISNDSELVSLVKQYNETFDTELKEKIIKNDFFREYKVAETDLNIIILQINQKLKEITNKGMC